MVVKMSQKNIQSKIFTYKTYYYLADRVHFPRAFLPVAHPRIFRGHNRFSKILLFFKDNKKQSIARNTPGHVNYSPPPVNDP